MHRQSLQADAEAHDAVRFLRRTYATTTSANLDDKFLRLDPSIAQSVRIDKTVEWVCVVVGEEGESQRQTLDRI